MATLSDQQARDWYGPMLAHARRLTDHDPEDLVQTAFLILCRRGDWGRATLGGMCHIVGQAAIDRWRHEGRHPWGRALPLVDWTPPRVEGPERAVCDAETLAEVAALPWGSTLLDHAGGWTLTELAERHHAPIGTLKARFWRLRHGPLARLSPW
jgi:DNA-directed RNA polymerase specialized sigma24 family protein